MIFIGIDPGLTGAIAALDHNGFIVCIEDLPTMQIPGIGPAATIKREIDVLALRNLLRVIVPASESALCVMEHVSSLGTKVRGDQAKMSLAATKAAIMSTFRLLGYEPIRVTPQKWKRWYGLDSDKDKCLATAREIYRDPPHLVRKKDHNRAEALLIARYAQRTLT